MKEQRHIAIHELVHTVVWFKHFNNRITLLEEIKKLEKKDVEYQNPIV